MRRAFGGLKEDGAASWSVEVMERSLALLEWRKLKLGRADEWCFLGTECEHYPGHEGQDQAWPEGEFEEIEDVEKADLRWVAQPIHGAQQPHGQHEAGDLLSLAQVCSPYWGIAGGVEGDAQTQDGP